MKKLCLFYFLFLCLNSFAQDRTGANLVFSVNKGLSFKDTTAYPKSFKSNCLCAYANSATLSNNKGKMIMYYAQDTFHYGKGKGGGCDFKAFGYIADSLGHKIKGTDSVYSAQGEDADCLFLPDPQDTSIFWFCYIENNTGYGGMGLATIKFKVGDTAINVLERKLCLSNDSLRNAIRAVKHGNGRDWWLICKNDANNEWIRFLLTPKGIGSPQYQLYGKLPYTYGGNDILSVSIDGEHIFLPKGPDIVSFKFDRCTGILSNYQRFHDTTKLNIAGDWYSSVFYDAMTKIVIASNYKYISAYSINTTDTLITKHKIIKSLASFNDTTNGNLYGAMLYNPLNPKYLYIYVSRPYYTCDADTNSLRNTLSLIQYSDTGHITVTDKFITLDTSDEIWVPGFIQPNYSLGRLEGSVCDTLSTSLKELVKKNASLKIFPNPTLTSFTLFTSDEAEATIYDVLGRSVLSEHIQDGYNNINSTQWPQGVYVIAVKYKNGFVENRKVVKD